MTTPEARLRADVLAAIRRDYPPSKRQVLVFGRPANASTGPGHPDLFGVALGHFLAFELKFGPKAKPTDLQVQRIQDLRAAGGYAWVIRTTLDAIKAVYWAKKGKTVPEPNDPIDFDEWFKDISTQPVQGEPLTETAEDPVITAALEAGIDVAEPVVEPPYQSMTEHNGADAPSFVDIPRDLPIIPPQIPTGGGLYSPAIQALDGVMRTVGDRITEVWERLNIVDAKLNLILTEMGVEMPTVVVAEPPKVRRTRKPKAQPEPEI